jgi:hypothetical protein
MSNIHDLDDDDDEAMKIDIRENIFWEVEETLKVLWKFWWENELVSFLFCEMKTDTDEW